MKPYWNRIKIRPFFSKKGDTILITAVKGGHKDIVDALMSRHVEIDAIGNVILIYY